MPHSIVYTKDDSDSIRKKGKAGAKLVSCN
jgi:hypothetical protein